jgi:hypothetical protein
MNLIPLALAAFAAASPIREVPLDDSRVIPIAVPHDQGTTTILFPAAIQGLRAAKVGSEFQLAYTPGQSFFSIRALHPEAADVVTVLYNRKAYVLQISASAAPNYSVTFFEPSTGSNRPVTPSRLLGLLDKAKALPVLTDSRLLRGVTVAAPNTVSRYADFTATLEQVIRFDADDTLVFRVRFRSSGPVAYQPDALAVRVADRIYTAALVDASGVINPGEPAIAWFVVTASPDGSRNHLAPDNDWQVLVTRLDTPIPLIGPPAPKSTTSK